MRSVSAKGDDGGGDHALGLMDGRTDDNDDDEIIE